MEIREVPIAKIRSSPYNPRTVLQPGDPEYEAIKSSIEKFGLIDPLVWNEKTGNLVGGHQRLRILAATGVKKVKVSVVRLTLDDEKQLNVILNRTRGDLDSARLKLLLSEMAPDSLARSVFSKKELV